MIDRRRAMDGAIRIETGTAPDDLSEETPGSEEDLRLFECLQLMASLFPGTDGYMLGGCKRHRSA